MKLREVVVEDANSATASNDYEQMQAFVRANRVQGVPPEQQMALALFKELQKQKQQNNRLSAELSDAEKRIDQATQSNELQSQELGIHATELERERQSGEEQKARVGQLGQTYAEREQASRDQIEDLAAKLEAVKSMPGVNKDVAERLENQIKELSEKGMPAERVQELEQSIAQIQGLQVADDEMIKDLVKQVNDAQAATKELKKTKKSVGKDAEETAQRALDQIEQIKQQLAHFQSVENETALLTQQVNKLSQKQAIIDKQKAANLSTDTANMAKDAAAPGQLPLLSPAGPSPQMSLPGVETPAPAPVTGSQLELPGVDQTQTEPARARNIVGTIKQANPADRANVYEAQLQNAIRWATGKTK